ncbi:hypothetical protein BDR26DRAFT_151063 [Obelidium mucronatum]|nr:hypothetical protein BDR26DRAFT_151063 [Obelidium mucronatum]
MPSSSLAYAILSNYQGASEIPIQSMLRGSLLARATVGIQTPLRLGVVLLLLASSAEILVYLSGSTISGFYPALATRDATRFFTLIGTAAILYILSSLMGVLRSWAQGCLAALLRRNLTAALHQRYVSKNNLYNIAMKASCPKEYMTQNASFREPTQNFDMDGHSEYSGLLMNDGMREDQSPPLDNPDQTIVQDAGKFGEQASELLVKFITIPSSHPLLHKRGVQHHPNHRGTDIDLYFFLGIVVAVPFRNECSCSSMCSRKSAVRETSVSTTVHARTEAEAIAMMHCESGERRRLDSLMASLVNATFVVLEKTVPLDYCITLTGFFGALISYLVISIPVFDGTFDGKT